MPYKSLQQKWWQEDKNTYCWVRLVSQAGQTNAVPNALFAHPTQKISTQKHQ